MFYYVSGTLAAKEYGFAAVDCGGIAYRLTVSENTFLRLGELGSHVKLFTYLYLREDVCELFGFVEQAEEQCFRQLIAISGVGPKAAISILSTVTPQNFALCVLAGDYKALAKANGIGPKTAQRIILELKDKLGKTATGHEAELYQQQSSPSTTGKSKLSDAVEALTVMGYSRTEALDVLRKLDVENLELEELIRQGLRAFMKA